MFGLGMTEILIILAIFTIIFGARKLPELGGALGKSIKNFRRAVEGKEDIEAKPGQ
ncbi:MAG: twin-arginine translocase TatA/TatE family subunit [Syntrophotaleaceae bacterium]